MIISFMIVIGLVQLYLHYSKKLRIKDELLIDTDMYDVFISYSTKD